jgi:hypothetical protein
MRGENLGSTPFWLPWQGPAACGFRVPSHLMPQWLALTIRCRLLLLLLLALTLRPCFEAAR